MPGLGAPELLIVLVIVLLLFGSTRLPKLARSLGASPTSSIISAAPAGAGPG